MNNSKARLAQANKIAAALGYTVQPCGINIRYDLATHGGGVMLVAGDEKGEAFAVMTRAGRIVAVVFEGAGDWNACRPSEEKASLVKEFALRANIFADHNTLSGCIKAAIEKY